MVFDTYIGESELPVKVSYSFTSGRPAKINAPMEYCYPEEPDDAEIESVTVRGKDIYPCLSSVVKEELEEKALNHAIESAIDHAEQKADYERTQRGEC